MMSNEISKACYNCIEFKQLNNNKLKVVQIFILSSLYDQNKARLVSDDFLKKQEMG